MDLCSDLPWTELCLLLYHINFCISLWFRAIRLTPVRSVPIISLPANTWSKRLHGMKLYLNPAMLCKMSFYLFQLMGDRVTHICVNKLGHQIMACCLISLKPLFDPMLLIGPREQIPMKFELKFVCFHSRKCVKCHLVSGSHFFSQPQCVNSLWPSDTIWQHRSGSTLAQVMACCLRAPSHCLSEPMLIYLQRCSMAFSWQQFREKCSRIQSVTLEHCVYFKVVTTSPRAQ